MIHPGYRSLLVIRDVVLRERVKEKGHRLIRKMMPLFQTEMANSTTQRSDQRIATESVLFGDHSLHI